MICEQYYSWFILRGSKPSKSNLRKASFLRKIQYFFLKFFFFYRNMIEKTSVENISGFWYDLSGTDIMQCTRETFMIPQTFVRWA